jgi:hypothetical protein
VGVAARALVLHAWSDDDQDDLLDALEDLRRRGAAPELRDRSRPEGPGGEPNA